MTAIYVHIPFCKSKCGYCAFNSRPVQSPHELKDYFKALSKELNESATWLSTQKIETIYFGGGTPTLADPNLLKRLLADIQATAGRTKSEMEITIEANPETVDQEKLDALFDAGFNRLSLGAQSFDLKALHFLERNHRPRQVEKAVLAARKAGFKNISLDVIIGLPKPHYDTFKSDVKRAIWLEPEHISVYLLTAEEPSRLYKAVSKGQVTLPGEDAQADCFLESHQILTERGFEHYEVSNYGLPGFYSQHNQAYWNGTPYLGIGAGAHSYIPTSDRPIRRANSSDPNQYMHYLDQGEDPVDFSEIITPQMAFAEKLMLDLRTAKGVCPADFGTHGEVIRAELEKLAPKGWYEWDGERFCVTPEGFLVADGVAASVFDVIEEEIA